MHFLLLYNGNGTAIRLLAKEKSIVMAASNQRRYEQNMGRKKRTLLAACAKSVCNRKCELRKDVSFQTQSYVFHESEGLF